MACELRALAPCPGHPKIVPHQWFRYWSQDPTLTTCQFRQRSWQTTCGGIAVDMRIKRNSSWDAETTHHKAGTYATRTRRMTLPRPSVELLHRFMWSREWLAPLEASRLKPRVPRRNVSTCDSVHNPAECCYRTDLHERYRAMSEWSQKHWSPQLRSLPVLYLYSGVDLSNAFFLFPDAPAFVLVAYHPAFVAGEGEDIFAETRRCLESSTCSSEMLMAGTAWYEHTLCLGFRSSMSSWMAGKHFIGHGTLPALLLSCRLLGLRIVGVKLVDGPSLSGLILHVRRLQQHSDVGTPPLQTIVYLASAISEASVGTIFDEIARHVQPSAAVMLNKAILFDSHHDQSVARHLHAQWLRPFLSPRTPTKFPIHLAVQDESGLACELVAPSPFPSRLPPRLPAALTMYGDCGRQREWAAKSDARKRSKSIFACASAESGHETALPFMWSHPIAEDEASEGCLIAMELDSEVFL